MSVAPPIDVFCTIMSTFTDSSARAEERGDAGLVGAPVIVTLPPRRVVGDGGDDRGFHRSVLLGDHVPAPT
jgi:hypothetical protein